MRLKPRADEGGETGETGDLDPPLIKASVTVDGFAVQRSYQVFNLDDL